MNSIQTSHYRPRGRDFLLVMILIQFIMCFTVVLNIIVARQVIGFLYLTFVPGILLLRMLKIDKLSITEILLFSAGLSIAFIMFIGLLINLSCPLIGISKSFSQVPLMIIFNGVMLSLCFLSYLKGKDFNFSLLEGVKLSPLTLLPFCLPLLSVIGVLLARISPGNDSVLLLMIITISALIILATLSDKIPPKLYPWTLLMIAIAMLFQASLILDCWWGGDIISEYRMFSTTQNKLYWDPTFPYIEEMIPRFNAMLTLTVLPLIYSSILNIGAFGIFNIIYPLILSFVPLGLYQLYETQVRKKVAFTSTFFLMANATFFIEIVRLARQSVAELFYILLFLVLLNKKMNPLKKRIFFIIFSFGLVVSHYSTSYLFLFTIFFIWLSGYIGNNTRKITASLVAIYCLISLSWYIFISMSAPFNNIVSVGNQIYSSLTEFFIPQSRGATVLKGLGMEGASSFCSLMSRIFAYATEFFILIGFTTLIIKRKKMTFDNEYFLVTSLSMATLAMCIVIPSFATSFNMTRFYHLTLFFLSPICILGGETIFGFMHTRHLNLKLKNKESFVLGLTLIILIPFFLFQTGFIYEAAGDDSWSLPSMWRTNARLHRSMGLIDNQDVIGAGWLSKNTDTGPIYAYKTSRSVLAIYGMMDTNRIFTLYNTTKVPEGTVIYLRRMDPVNRITGEDAEQWNKIYSNGGSMIFQALPSP